MKHETKLLQECLEHLSTLPNIQATWKNDFHTVKADPNSHKYLIIESPIKAVNYICNIQPSITIRTAELLIAYFKLQQKKLLKISFLLHAIYPKQLFKN